MTSAEISQILQKKACSHCAAILPVSEFYRNRGKPDGLNGFCKVCHRASSGPWRDAHPGKSKEYTHRYNLTHKEKLRLKNQAYSAGRPSSEGIAKLRKWGERNPERLRMANVGGSALHQALRSGKIQRETHCEECGTSERRIEAAHYDYSQPLRVRWLCRPCHVRWDQADPKTLKGLAS